MKKLAALIIVLALGVGFTASTGITVKTLTDQLFGVNNMPVSYSDLPFGPDDGIITAGAKSADFIVDEATKAEQTIHDVLNQYKDTLKQARSIVGGN